MPSIKEQVNAEAKKIEAAAKAEVAESPQTVIVIAIVLGFFAVMAALVLLY